MVLPPGDDGTNKEATSTGKLNQENEHIYNLWCSGRVCCEGMLIQLRVSGELPVQCMYSYHFFQRVLKACKFSVLVSSCLTYSEI